MDNESQQSGSRRRGRPAGRQRIPLSLDERRARNAQYERERRVVFSERLAELATAAGYDSSISSTELLASVLIRIRQASEIDHSAVTTEDQRINDYYRAQIADLEQLVGKSDDGCLSPKQNQPVKRKRSDSGETPEGQTPVPELEFQQCSSDYEYHPTDLRREGQCSMSNGLPVPQSSPLDDTCEWMAPENCVSLDPQYRVAGARVPTPEYRIVSGPPEHVPVASPSPQAPTSFGDPILSHRCSTPSPPPFGVPLTDFDHLMAAPSTSTTNQVWTQQPLCTAPVEFPGRGSVQATPEPVPAPGGAVSPGVAAPSGEGGDINLMSFEDMIAMYLS